MYRHDLSKGGYRLLLWLLDNYGVSGKLNLGRGSWAVKARNDLGYTQPMISMLTSEFLRKGLFQKTSFSILFDLSQKVRAD